ncbi:MAG TPA: hypothetical protein VEJ23_04000 [Solirubrobacteraceae bacterium]|nr:hypothetical protein [Solirubrobacteraceae bacterium]
MTPPLLLAVPNVSEGRDERVIAAIGEAFAGGGESARGVRLLDVHSDPDHHRSVYTLVGPPGALADTLVAGARAAVERVDVMHAGGEGRAAESAEDAAVRQHPFVGALDVAPVVYVRERDRGAACAEALVVADRIGEELGVPVFLYGELTADDGSTGRTRAQLRQGGVRELARRMAAPPEHEERDACHAEGRSGDSLAPDFGPARMHVSAGATLVAARAPLVAFNVQLAEPAGVGEARAIAARIREGGEEGLQGVRAIGVRLGVGVAQVSMNVERPRETPLGEIVAAISAHAPVASAELVGLAPRAALEGFPRDVNLQDFDPARHVIENALGFG